uniref:Uncharacterized protein n=1 Tax=Ditylenchus dipsaci TaxID=166011 RepID=A0A915DJW7_9BILA
MSGQYIIPLLNNADNHHSPFHLVALVAIGLSDTNQLCPDHLAQLVTPCLMLRGMFDTYISLNASNVLSLMPHSRIVVEANGRHLCHHYNPQSFHELQSISCM